LRTNDLSDKLHVAVGSYTPTAMVGRLETLIHVQEVSVQILARTPKIIADVILPIICLTTLSVQGEMKFVHKIAILGLRVNIRGGVIQHVLRHFLLAIHVTVKGATQFSAALFSTTRHTLQGRT